MTFVRIISFGIQIFLPTLLGSESMLGSKLRGVDDLLPVFSTTPNLVESVFQAGDGSEKAFYRRADSRLPQAGGGRC
ncbi:hypothetical protein R0D10_0030000, partial [Pseudomonas aeruginosa]|uniref:hypothetical protein n=4 Tax=Pseudomonas aeruginosa TaxID=287 RepID=UPI0019698C17